MNKLMLQRAMAMEALPFFNPVNATPQASGSVSPQPSLSPAPVGVAPKRGPGRPRKEQK